MFTLGQAEFASWRSQNVISSSDLKGLRHAPMAFTEQGVAMLSGVLNSDRAIAVNVAIMRTFVRLRKILENNEVLSRRLASLEQKYDEQFKVVFDVLRDLMTPPDPPKRRIGFDT